MGDNGSKKGGSGRAWMKGSDQMEEERRNVMVSQLFKLCLPPVSILEWNDQWSTIIDFYAYNA